MFKYIMCLLLITACQSNHEYRKLNYKLPEYKHEIWSTITIIYPSTRRFENSEIICYEIYNNISCKWKDNK